MAACKRCNGTLVIERPVYPGDAGWSLLGPDRAAEPCPACQHACPNCGPGISEMPCDGCATPCDGCGESHYPECMDR